jgi:hypothetical protein
MGNGKRWTNRDPEKRAAKRARQRAAGYQGVKKKTPPAVMQRAWRAEARLTRLELAAVEEREARADALALGLLADSFVELGALSYYDAEEWEQ